jgi:hypothetical protein
MNADQANAVLRTVAEQVLEKAQYIYGIGNAEQAREVIQEALVVDKASREANQNNKDHHG